jgi:hypothetical protein
MVRINPAHTKKTRLFFGLQALLKTDRWQAPGTLIYWRGVLNYSCVL